MIQVSRVHNGGLTGLRTSCVPKTRKAESGTDEEIAISGR